jgi:hypothetical protein
MICIAVRCLLLLYREWVGGLAVALAVLVALLLSRRHRLIVGFTALIVGFIRLFAGLGFVLVSGLLLFHDAAHVGSVKKKRHTLAFWALSMVSPLVHRT